MNSTTLISQAGYAIDMFKIDCSGTLCLCIKSGFVRAVPAGEASQRTPSCLKLTRFEQIRGLTISRWHTIGSALLNLYTKEKECQQPQKP